MCKFETVYLIYKSMSSVLTPQVFLKHQTSPPPFRAFRNHRVLTSKVREFFIASEQFLYSRFLPIKLHPFITSFSENQGQNSAAEIAEAKFLTDIPKWPVFTIAAYDFHWRSLKNMSFTTCRISTSGPPETPWFDTWYFDPKKIRCLKMGPQK